MKKITDLDDFALVHIIRPYQNLIWLWDDRVKSSPYTLNELCTMLKKHNEWSCCVLDRIQRIWFTFPEYVNHELIEIIKKFKSIN